MELKRPGGMVSQRHLDLTLMIDKSASMNEAGKMSSLNSACRKAVPYIRQVQSDNPTALIRLNTLVFSHGANWVSNEPVPAEKFEWSDIAADPMPKASSGKAEIVFLIDTSGSMGDEIDSVKESCIKFASTIEKEGVEVELGLVGFSIGGYRGNSNSKFKVHTPNRYTIGVWNLAKPSVFKSNIQDLQVGIFGFGGCYLADDDTVEIFPYVKNVFGKETKRILVIISDEIGMDSGLNRIVKILKDASITTFVLGVSGAAHKNIAKQTGGEFWDINKSKGKADFTSLLVGNVAETIGKEMKKTLSDGSVSHGTDMGAAIKLLTERIKIENFPSRALPPVSILVSDGQPTDDFRTALDTFNKEPWAQKMVRLAIAIGADCDLKVMQDFINNKEIKPFEASNPGQLTRYLKFASTVVLKQASTPTNSGIVKLPEVDPASKEEKVW